MIFLGGATDALGWANGISGGCCNLLDFGLLYFWRVLLMHSDGPIALAMLLPITSLGPIRFLGGTPNAFEWAHSIGRCYCYWLHFGLLFFWKALPMHSGGPITLGNTAPDGFALAHYFSTRLCQCTLVGLLY